MFLKRMALGPASPHAFELLGKRQAREVGCCQLCAFSTVPSQTGTRTSAEWKTSYLIPWKSLALHWACLCFLTVRPFHTSGRVGSATPPKISLIHVHNEHGSTVATDRGPIILTERVTLHYRTLRVSNWA